ncbi:MAG: hypothetical protein FP833_12280, partial [Atribacteria sp.]|nr:hypothetical protein [Candidatus Atribacteria bacterium]
IDEIIGQNVVELLIPENQRHFVYKKMKNFLVSVDLEELPSVRQKRWRNTAMWEKSHMVKDGLLKSDSPRGIWEISEKGKKYLKEQVVE